MIDSQNTSVLNTTEERIEMAKKFLDTLYGNVVITQYSYIWVMRKNEKSTISFNIADEAERQKMAEEGIRYNDEGYDVYFGVCPVAEPLPSNRRASKKDYPPTLQPAVWTDIDTEGGTHINDKGKNKIYPPNFDTAKLLLPITASMLINSGYGLHGYFIFDEPLILNENNRIEAEIRNANLISIIRTKADSYTTGIDSVQDLSRVLRLPGTYNYKLGCDNSVLCQTIEINDVRYSISDLDSQISKLILELPSTPISHLEINHEPKMPPSIENFNIESEEVSREEAIKRIKEAPFTLMLDTEKAKNVGYICPVCNSGSGKNGTGITCIHDHYRCWNEGWGGDNLDWLKRTYGLTFNAALEYGIKKLNLKIVNSNQNGSCEIENNLPLIRNDSTGRVINCTENFDLVLREDPDLRGLIGYDDFSHRLIKRRQAPWDNIHVKDRTWVDRDDILLRHYIATKHGLRNKDLLADSLVVIANENSYHPVRDYLINLPEWDGISRAESIFIECLDVEDNEYSREISLHWLLAAVKRVFHPGCKFDYCLVITGGQGIGKTTVLAKLGGQFFNNSIDSINGKDALEQLQGSWIIEMGELQATKKSDNEAIKAFISRSCDRVRLPYARRAEEYPRQCVFSATTNDVEFLKDRTGGRRFWILEAHAVSETTAERLSRLNKEYIDQLWAEVYHKYREEEAEKGNVNLLPSSSVLQRATDIQSSYTEGGEIKALIENYLDTPIPNEAVWNAMSKDKRWSFIQGNTFYHLTLDESKGEVLRNRICSTEIMYELFGINNPNHNRSTLREVNTILANLQGWRRINSNGIRMGIYGIQHNVYERIVET